MSNRIHAASVIYAVLIVGSVVATPLVGFLGPFEGGNAGTQSALREYFLPAGYVFSVWGVIYLGLAGLGIWIGLPGQWRNTRAQAAAPWLAVTAVFNVVWILLAGERILTPWTVPTLLVMEVSAWLAYLRLEIHRGLQIHRDRNHPRLERLLHIPLRIYVGWLSVATVANTATALNVLGWSGWGITPITWTVIMIVAATSIAFLVGSVVRDNVYRGVFVWAYVGIWFAQSDVPVVAWAALGAAVVLVLVMALSRLHPRSEQSP